MPKLKLDIFEDRPTQTEMPPSYIESPGKESREIIQPTLDSDRLEKRKPAQNPHFIPVGFYEEHLRLLDEAVLKQRRQGNWQASKSAIIRGLIERHKEELDNLLTRTQCEGQKK